jgi:NitT/TauT family transport system permease protein
VSVQQSVRQIVEPGVVVAVAIVAWEIAVRAFRIKPFILPAPSTVLGRIASQPGLFLWNSLVTLQEIVIGLGAAVLVGVVLGILLASWPLSTRVVYPLLVSSQTIPKVALAPLFVIWFGFDMTPKVLVTFLIAFFPVIVDTAGGLASVDEDLVRLARVMRGNAWRVFWKVRLPSALPQMFAGFKVAATLAVVGAVVGEFVGADNGLGWVLIQANGQADTSLAFAAILVMAIIGTLLFHAVVLAERWLIPWHVVAAEGERA